jgi:hypothetical protein
MFAMSSHRSTAVAHTVRTVIAPTNVRAMSRRRFRARVDFFPVAVWAWGPAIISRPSVCRHPIRNKKNFHVGLSRAHTEFFPAAGGDLKAAVPKKKRRALRSRGHAMAPIIPAEKVKCVRV